MLLYANAEISELEIPGKQSLVIYISGCPNKCHNCHAPYLHEEFGDILSENFEKLFDLFRNYFDVLCILGEGKRTNEDISELLFYCEYAHLNGKKFALYSGRDCGTEDWMKSFDYVKVGSYIEQKGPLTSETTNQKLFEKVNSSFVDITCKFWK